MKVSARMVAPVTLVALIGTVMLISGSTNESEVRQIAGYRQWTRLGDAPRVVTEPGVGG